ncbi:hypothetical protein F383_14745 [Gossypium arboreum]|nr:hypothetical protein F383_14745 [Gossypium arboreum]
MCYRVRPRLGR